MTIQGTTPVIQAHRGYSECYPENTMLAFRQAIANGADGVECDLWISADGEFVICHDDTLDRTTNGAGAISGLT